MSLAELLSDAFTNVSGYQMPFIVFSILAAVVVILLFAMPVGGICTYLERKISADFQERIGPNRVGPIGLLQFFADGIKMFLKEDIANKNADLIIYNIAPALVMAGSLGAFAAVPFAKYVIGANLDIGVFYVMAVGSLVSLGILLGAWSSDNKWSLMGGVRAAAQIVSYEIPLGIAVLSVVLVSGSMNLVDIVDMQAWPSGEAGHFWFIFHNPFLTINFFIYFIASLAECNRTPFDLAEAESELVSGFNTEFSGMRFGLYALAEFIDVIMFCCVAVALFFGGWNIPFINLTDIQTGWRIFGGSADILIQTLFMIGVFLSKVAVLIFIVMWIRWTLPRLRVDQLMALCWKYLIPIGLFNLVGAAIWMLLFHGRGLIEIIGIAGGHH
ncbi:MAG: NADH-quinone oxidoreductase subunit NuoH [Bdellovibrionota bacterium]